MDSKQLTSRVALPIYNSNSFALYIHMCHTPPLFLHLDHFSHPINTVHNILRPIAELQYFGDHLIFMEENQGIASWGIHRDDCRERNPIVWQGQNIDENEFELEDEPQEWFEEEYRLKQFLMAMWKWTLTGKQEEGE